MQIIDGRKLAGDILKEIRDEAFRLDYRPVFCDLLVGDNPASAQYVRMKARTAERIGFRFRQAEYPADIKTGELVAEIKKINREPHMCGLIVQLPLPPGLDKAAVLDAIDPEIDVDCIGSANSRKFYEDRPYLVFPTAAAVMAMLDHAGQDLSGKKIVIIGQGELVGRPVRQLLRRQGFEPEAIDRSTAGSEDILRAADIIISAAGQAGLVTAGKVKSGAIIIDAGTSESDGGIAGDVDADSLSGLPGFLSPVPGGVGPVTVAMLMKNILTVAKRKQQ